MFSFLSLSVVCVGLCEPFRIVFRVGYQKLMPLLLCSASFCVHTLPLLPVNPHRHFFPLLCFLYSFPLLSLIPLPFLLKLSLILQTLDEWKRTSTIACSPLKPRHAKWYVWDGWVSQHTTFCSFVYSTVSLVKQKTKTKKRGGEGNIFGEVNRIARGTVKFHKRSSLLMVW